MEPSFAFFLAAPLISHIPSNLAALERPASRMIGQRTRPKVTHTAFSGRQSEAAKSHRLCITPTFKDRSVMMLQRSFNTSLLLRATAGTENKPCATDLDRAEGPCEDAWEELRHEAVPRLGPGEEAGQQLGERLLHDFRLRVQEQPQGQLLHLGRQGAQARKLSQKETSNLKGTAQAALARHGWNGRP
jgi:hypothetical protein